MKLFCKKANVGRPSESKLQVKGTGFLVGVRFISSGPVFYAILEIVWVHVRLCVIYC